MARRTWTLETARRLRRELRLAFPFRLRSTAKLAGDDCGLTTLEGKGAGRYFLIRISRRLSDEMARETLIHELGHAVAFNHLDEQPGPDDETWEWHGPRWGVAYAEVYRVANKVDEHYG